jgi:hypothetical protein
MIGFDRIICVLLDDMARGGQQLVKHSRVGRRPVRGHLARAWAVLKRAGEEPAGGRQIPLPRDQDVNDLPVLVDRPVQIDPSPGDLDVGLVHEPPVTWRVPTRSGRVDQQRGEPLHPAIDGDVVYLDAPFGQQLLHVAIRQSEAQLPSHHHHDHLRWEAETGEARPRRGHSGKTTTHQPSLPARDDPPMQQCRPGCCGGIGWSRRARSCVGIVVWSPRSGHIHTVAGVHPSRTWWSC